jgi:hypothetical protein
MARARSMWKSRKPACLVEKAEGREVHGGDETDAGERLKIRRGDAFARVHEVGNENPIIG